MSECVVRMEMPKNCYECEMRGAWAFCPIGKWPVVGYKKQRHEDCPIICSLPEGHGRLIDASTIIGETVDAGYDDYGNPIPVNRPVSVDEYLGLEVPTIVPADAERSDT